MEIFRRVVAVGVSLAFPAMVLSQEIVVPNVATGKITKCSATTTKPKVHRGHSKPPRFFGV